MDFTSRTEALLGKDAITKLNNARVAIFGLGGVGGFVVEALVRAGVGEIAVIDFDTVSLTNINRQIIATVNTIGRKKTDLIKERALSINPNIKVNTFDLFYSDETESQFDFSNYDYIVDAVDTVSAKVKIILNAINNGVSVISCMGTGNKLDPTAFKVEDISKTSYCPLAKAVRHELKKHGVENGVKVLFSTEQPLKTLVTIEDENKKDGRAPGSISFVPPVAGLIIGGQVIKDLIGEK